MAQRPDSSQLLRGLLTTPTERQDLDCKASKALVAGDEFALKLVKHILGFANAGGGYLLIGYKETESGPVPDPDHSETICGSYDGTDLSKLVDANIERGGDPIRLTVHLPVNETTGLRHPVIEIEPFAHLPYVCRGTKPEREPILKQGMVYLRRHRAETSEVCTAADWELLINQCMSRRREEFVTEFTDLFQRMTKREPTPANNATELKRWNSEARARAVGGSN
jgi:predicted HTH transcriptional regulator